MNYRQRFPARRLLSVAVLSACLHLSLLLWLGRDTPRPADAQAAPSGTIEVRLAAAPKSTARDAQSVSSAPEPMPGAMPAAMPAAAPAPDPATSAPPAPESGAPSLPPTVTSSPGNVASAGSGVGGDDDAGEQMPGRYNVQLPPSVELSFEVLEGVAMTPRAAPSRLAWQSDGQRYSLRFENVPDVYGAGARTLISEGGVNDGGVAPDSMLEQQQGGAQTRTGFDREADRIALASGRTVPLSHSTQDSASLLMQLSGIALSNPDQMRGTVEFEVAGSAGHGVVRFDVSGPDQLATPFGALSAWHLTQQAKPGEVRLEVWLAPALSWYPVQLRTSGANGVIALQRLRTASVQLAPAPSRP